MKGVAQVVRKCFLDYGNFTYNRVATFDALPDPAYIPAANPLPGWFEYLAVQDPAVPTFTIGQGSITAVVPQLAANQGLACVEPRGFRPGNR